MAERDDARAELAGLVRDVAAYARYMRQIGDAYLSPPPSAAEQGEESMPRTTHDPAVPSLFDDAPAEVADDTLDRVRADIGECTRCKLHEGRTHIVFGEGSPTAELMFVGEGPGADEDATGRPFVGAAGKLLDRIVEAIGFRRDEVYIANVVKCRPPGNRKPEKDETSTCQQFLFRQLDVVKPKVIVALG